MSHGGRISVDFDLAPLDAWLTTHIPGYCGPLSAEKFAFGQSNPTYRLDTPGRAYVLRRKPFGHLLPSAHAVDREFRVLSALGPAGFPVPPAYALCMDDQIIGSHFYVMGLVDGNTYWNGTLPGFEPAARRTLYEAMVDTLAALHNLDPVAVGLGDFGRPGNYFARQVERWSKQYRASETERHESIERVMMFLASSAPEQVRTSVVHGDYRIDNMIFAEHTPKVEAVLDWELSTLGDPLADFSYLLMNWVLPSDGRASLVGADLEALGIPTLSEVVARYCAATGRDGLPDLDWYFAYNLFRIAAILQGIKKRALDGNASSADALKVVRKIPLLGEVAWAYAQKAGA